MQTEYKDPLGNDHSGKGQVGKERSGNEHSGKEQIGRDAAKDAPDAAAAARRELDDAKARLSDAADRVRHEARHAGATLSMLMLDELDRRAADMGTQIRSVAGRLRGDKAEQTSSGLADQAADLIEDVSARLEGQSVRDMGERLGRFGRENPALFVMGCLLTGALAGRMIIASGDGGSRSAQAQSYPKRTASADQTSRAQGFASATGPDARRASQPGYGRHD